MSDDRATAGIPGTVPTPLIGSLMQICTVTHDLRETVAGYVRLGIGPFAVRRFDPSNTTAVYKGRPTKFTYDNALTHDLMWEVSQPIDGDSMFSDFLADVSGSSGYQHIAVHPVLPYDETLAALAERGFGTLMELVHWEVVRVTYVVNDGQVIELVDVPPGFDMGAHPPDYWIPAAPPS